MNGEDFIKAEREAYNELRRVYINPEKIDSFREDLSNPKTRTVIFVNGEEMILNMSVDELKKKLE